MKAPIILNFGMGVDSTAVLVGLHKRGERPDLVIFADTGGEKPETYAFLPVINAWLRKVGFPEVTVVKYRPTFAKYDNLYDNAVINETLPSIAFRGGKTFDGGCSLKFKGAVMDSWLEGASRGPWKGDGWAPLKAVRAAGLRPVKLIGFDDSDADRKRTAKALKRGRVSLPAEIAEAVGTDVADAIERTTERKDDGFDYRYPLQEWGWTRERCIAEIEAAGLPVPVKSACFFCPASKKWEIMWLAAKHPDLFLKAIAMEDGAAAGKHGLGPKRGLGINFRWRAYAEKEGFLEGDAVAGSRAQLMARAMAEKPPHEANTDTLIQIGG